MLGDLIREYLELAPESPSYLRWRKTAGRRGIQGQPALCTIRSDGYMKGKLKRRALSSHRAVFFLVHGYLPEEVDHIDRCKTNNRPDNLRAANRSSNCHNKGFKGFNWDLKAGKYRVRVNVTPDKRVTVGYYEDALTARAEYLRFKNKHNLI